MRRRGSESTAHGSTTTPAATARRSAWSRNGHRPRRRHREPLRIRRHGRQRAGRPTDKRTAQRHRRQSRRSSMGPSSARHMPGVREGPRGGQAGQTRDRMAPCFLHRQARATQRHNGVRHMTPGEHVTVFILRLLAGSGYYGWRNRTSRATWADGADWFNAMNTQAHWIEVDFEPGMVSR